MCYSFIFKDLRTIFNLNSPKQPVKPKNGHKRTFLSLNDCQSFAEFFTKNPHLPQKMVLNKI